MKFAISEFDIVLLTDAGVRTVGLDHPFYIDICRNLKSGKFDKVLELLDAKTKLVEQAAAPLQKLGLTPDVKLTDSSNATESRLTSVATTVDGLEIKGRLADMISDFKRRGIPFTALKLFWEKLQKNPLLVGKESLLDFLTYNNVPLLPNGNFLAYKGVYETDDPKVFASQHDRGFLYTLGQVAELDREKCTVDVLNACGPGLHVGGFAHARGYGNTILDCEVDPADVTSVPKSENCKLRACRVLPVRVHSGNEPYCGDYIDLNKRIVVNSQPAAEGVTTSGQDSVCADTKPKPSGGRTPKKTWYKLVGNRVLTQRKVRCPGDGWTATRPVVSSNDKRVKKAKNVTLRGAREMRTWYKVIPGGLLQRKRAVDKPAGYSSHKPTGF